MSFNVQALEPALATSLQSMCNMMMKNADDHATNQCTKLDSIENSIKDVKTDLENHKKETASTFAAFIERFKRIESTVETQDCKINSIVPIQDDISEMSGVSPQPEAKRTRFAPALGTSASSHDLTAPSGASFLRAAPIMGAPRTLRISTFSERKTIDYRKNWIKTFFTDNAIHHTLIDNVKIKYGMAMARDVLFEFPTHLEAKYFLTTYRDSTFLKVGDLQFYMGFAKFGRDKVVFILTGKIHKILMDMYTSKTITLLPTPDKQSGALFVGPHLVATLKVGAEWCPRLRKYPATIQPHAEASDISFDAITFCSDITRNLLDKY